MGSQIGKQAGRALSQYIMKRKGEYGSRKNVWGKLQNRVQSNAHNKSTELGAKLDAKQRRQRRWKAGF